MGRFGCLFKIFFKETRIKYVNNIISEYTYINIIILYDIWKKVHLSKFHCTLIKSYDKDLTS